VEHGVEGLGARIEEPGGRLVRSTTADRPRRRARPRSRARQEGEVTDRTYRTNTTYVTSDAASAIAAGRRVEK
jgi:hypothetical protein